MAWGPCAGGNCLHCLSAYLSGCHDFHTKQIHRTVFVSRLSHQNLYQRIIGRQITSKTLDEQGSRYQIQTKIGIDKTQYFTSTFLLRHVRTWHHPAHLLLGGEKGTAAPLLTGAASATWRPAHAGACMRLKPFPRPRNMELFSTRDVGNVTQGRGFHDHQLFDISGGSFLRHLEAGRCAEGVTCTHRPGLSGSYPGSRKLLD
mmetsp:Transcript_26049/g.44351  ORF Transcript_26049/g.44351 Transcript_26049/m.44351 type:complete len:202 (+) Transcript_26049:116-721(+)